MSRLTLQRYVACAVYFPTEQVRCATSRPMDATQTALGYGPLEIWVGDWVFQDGAVWLICSE